MKENFEIAIRFVLFWERYISANPHDPGGLTIWGICARDYPDEVRKMRDMPPVESKEYTKEFYRKKFWNAINADTLPALIDIALFDTAINQGIGRAKEIASAAHDWRDVIILRLDKYDDIKGFSAFGKGWCKRLVSLRDYIASGYKILEWDREELVKAER